MATTYPGDRDDLRARINSVSAEIGKLPGVPAAADNRMSGEHGELAVLRRLGTALAGVLPAGKVDVDKSPQAGAGSATGTVLRGWLVGLASPLSRAAEAQLAASTETPPDKREGCFHRCAPGTETPSQPPLS